VWINHNNIYIVSVSKGNPNVMLIIAFLYKIVEVLGEYFDGLTDESMRDNFVVTYELLDEMMDNGYPQVTESKVLKEYITTESNKSGREKVGDVQVPVAASNAQHWRTENVKHSKNEAFLDVIEKLSAIISSNGTVLSSEIIGSIKMNSQLSGTPTLKLGLNDKVLFDITGRTSKSKLVEMDDVTFHECVNLTKFESERAITFIPPDGKFELMSYRLSTQVKPLFWVECAIESFSNTKIEFVVKARSQFKSRSYASNVEVIIPVPSDSNTPFFKSTVGVVKYLPDIESMVWCVSTFPGSKEYLMKARFGLPSINDERRNKFKTLPVQVKFEIPYFTVSGLQVRYLKIEEKSGYSALPWVRYITQNGEYQIKVYS